MGVQLSSFLLIVASSLRILNYVHAAIKESYVSFADAEPIKWPSGNDPVFTHELISAASEKQDNLNFNF